MSTQAGYQQFLNDFRDTIVAAKARLSDMSETQSRQKSSPEDWSPAEVLGHLIDSAANNHQRFVRAQFTDDLVFSGYEQNEWVNAQKYSEESWTDLVQLWRYYNLHLLHVFSAIPEDVLTRPRERHNLDVIAFAAVATSEPGTLEYLIRDYVVHLQHHLHQIFARTPA